MYRPRFGSHVTETPTQRQDQRDLGFSILALPRLADSSSPIDSTADAACGMAPRPFFFFFRSSFFENSSEFFCDFYSRCPLERRSGEKCDFFTAHSNEAPKKSVRGIDSFETKMKTLSSCKNKKTSARKMKIKGESSGKSARRRLIIILRRLS